MPFTRWGAWRAAHPDIGCGLKRGFSFYHHQAGQRWLANVDRNNELLVAASPHDRVADTHWYRPEFDQFLARRAQELGCELIEGVRLDGVNESSGQVHLSGSGPGGATVKIRARFVVDATGPRGFLHRALPLGEARFHQFPATSTVFTHFHNVACWGELHPRIELPPYAVDDAALHHVFEGGWIWVLRFNNGITSAGVVADAARAEQWRLAGRGSGWEECLQKFPGIRGQFAQAKPVMPWKYVRELPFRTTEVAHEWWALLPSAAGFVDPLLSSGFPLTLLGILRLGGAWSCGLNTPEFQARMRHYEIETLREADATAGLVAALYRNMHDFGRFSQISLLYFAAASFMETARRLDRPELAGDAFLALDHPWFGSRLMELLRQEQAGRLDGLQTLQAAVRNTIEPIDVAGLLIERRNWYPSITPETAAAAARKLGADELLAPRLLE